VEEAGAKAKRRKLRIKPSLHVDAIARLDTGASCHDFISKTLADELIAGGAAVKEVTGRVCSAFKAVGRSLSARVICKYSFVNHLTKKEETITIEPVILEDLNAPLIIGLQTIGTHQLLKKQIPELCTLTEDQTRPADHLPLDDPLTRKATVGETTAHVEKIEQQKRTIGISRSRKRKLEARRKGRPSVWPADQEGCELCLLQVSSRDFFGEAEDSEDEELERPPTNIAELLPPQNGGGGAVDHRGMSGMIAKIIFNGSLDFQEEMRTLCIEYEKIFAESVREQAAHLPPMSLEVDADVLRRVGKGRRAAPRPQSLEKMVELKQMIEDLLKLKVIRVSTAETASQVLLVAKKGTTKLRFCIDYRAINEATKARDTWPIPNIKTMLERLGAKRPRFFGVMDLTSGYHQAPLAESSKKWTAFVTAFGQFEWNRVAMGLCGAPSYFQRVMMTTVLGDVLTKAVEVYLDDFIVFGSTKEEFLQNMEEVFKRCLKAGVTLNPSKCRFGLERIEYVGHTIDHEGIHFSRQKIDSVLDMERPTNKGDMKTFLGMVNYFHSHVRGLSAMEVPLTRMIGEGYTKGKKKQGIHWTAEAISAFENIKVAIDECPKLFFRDQDLGPVYVQTDASVYGHGAYMFQLEADGVTHRPIDFISRTFPKACANWHIADKEAFAIFYAFRRWEHHLRDREFVLQTDHLNLTYLNYEGTAKVKRWKLLIQDFTFKIEFLKGDENIIADSFSRNCPRRRPEDGEELNILDSEFAAILVGGNELEIPPELTQEQEEGELNFLEFINEEFRYRGGDSQEYSDELMPIDMEAPIPDEIYAQIELCHNSRKGHKGVRRTEGRLRKMGAKIKHMREWVERFIKECPFCQKQSYKTRKVDSSIHDCTDAESHATN